jgi:transposase-like protein
MEQRLEGRKFTVEFKKQLVQLYASRKPRAGILCEYEQTVVHL